MWVDLEWKIAKVAEMHHGSPTVADMQDPDAVRSLVPPVLY